MVKGLKQTSAPIIISFSVEESIPDIFAQAQVAMQLNVLDRGSLSTTSRTTVGQLDDSNVIAVGKDAIRAAGFVDGGVGFSSQFGETPAAGMEYLQIIATNDFFVQVQGTNNTATRKMTGKLFCYRAVAEASVFAALVQSELLSA